jgi:predicted alpha/beta-hydrolase family hydrolase
MPTLVLAHGAGAGSQHQWMQRVKAGLGERGVQVILFDFPYMKAGKSVPDRAPVLEAAWREVWAEVARDADGPVFAGGKSMGGRMASMVAAKDGAEGFSPAPAGLIFFGYPLHPPGQPNKRRDEHLPRINVPMLFLHGTRDSFGTPDEMTALAASLPLATLHLCDGGDHSLVAGRKDGGKLLETAMDVAAEWMKRRG